MKEELIYFLGGSFMEEKEIVKIEADFYIRRKKGTQIGVAIICAPTGVLCTVQAGGAVCAHPTVEGYAIALHNDRDDNFFEELERLDDCGWGCHSTLGMREEVRFSGGTDWRYREDYALEIYKFLNENLNDKIVECIHFDFDYDRLNELMEGWWPVLVRFKEYPGKETYYNTEFKGYLHFGNCD